MEVKLTEAGTARYAARGLKAGDPIDLPAKKARLYVKRGWAKEDKPASK